MSSIDNTQFSYCSLYIDNISRISTCWLTTGMGSCIDEPVNVGVWQHALIMGCCRSTTSKRLSIDNVISVLNWQHVFIIVRVNAHFSFQIFFVLRSLHTSVGTDLSKSKLHPILKNLVIDGFTATWKTDDDPNNYGRKLVGPDYCYPVEHVETILDNAGRLYLTHPMMLKEEWVKDDLDPVMNKYMESGTYVFFTTLSIDNVVNVVNRQHASQIACCWLTTLTTLSIENFVNIVSW